MMSRLNIWKASEWAGLYLDGELLTEGHSIPLYEIIAVSRKNPDLLISDISELRVDEDWDAEVLSNLTGRFPALELDINKYPWVCEQCGEEEWKPKDWKQLRSTCKWRLDPELELE
jgi:hypothetical protein